MNNIPSYLTKDFLKATLENGLKTRNIEIENFSALLASAKGENYTSEIIRVCVNYKNFEQKNQQISLILKNIVLPEGEIKEILEKVNIVQIEIDMYTKMIPEIEKLFGNLSTFAPQCFQANREEHFLVLSDLKALGYVLQSRTTGLNEAHCKVVMKKIAQLHAGSMCAVKANPEYADIFNQPVFSEANKSEYFSKVFTANFEQMINVVRFWPEYKEIVVKLERIYTNFVKRGYEDCKPSEGQLKVVNHGDLWVNNIMFKYNENSELPSDATFVDFQMSYYSSLGIDINYFFNTSVQLEVLKSKREELLNIYYETMKSALEQFKYSPIPSWEDVKKEVGSKELYGLIMLGCAFPLIIMDKSASQNSTLETMLESSEEKTNAMFGSDRMKETLKYSLTRFDELGVLDE